MTDDLVKRLRSGEETCGIYRCAFRDIRNGCFCAIVAERIEELEAALRRIACDGEPYDKCHCVNSDECSYGIARAALGEKKDG